MRHECMRGALGNDIGIMAEHGTNEMTNGPTDWNRGPIGAPSKEGHGVIIQANKGRSYQDYRVPRAASRSPLPSSSHPSRGLLAPCLPVITGPNCSLFLLLSFSFAIVISPLSTGPLSSFKMPPASRLYVSFVPHHRSTSRCSSFTLSLRCPSLPSRLMLPMPVDHSFRAALSINLDRVAFYRFLNTACPERLSTDNSSEIDRSDGEFPVEFFFYPFLSLSFPRDVLLARASIVFILRTARGHERVTNFRRPRERK